MILALLGTGLLGAALSEVLVVHHGCTPDDRADGPHAPKGTGFLGSEGLKFVRVERTRLVLGQGADGALRLTGPLTLGAVVQLTKRPPSKVSVISKWRTTRGGRSYELGVTAARRLFFTISASGSWPERARELLSTRPLKVGVPYAVAAVFAPGKRMALFINGVPSGEVTDRVPAAIFDSPTPVLLGSRAGSEAACALDGILGGVWVWRAALDDEAIGDWAESEGLTAKPEPPLSNVEPPYDLDAAKAAARAWYRRLQAPGRPFGAYRLTASKPPDLYASADIAWIRWMMNDLELSEEERRQWIAFIQAQQRPDGSYRHITGHCATHAFCHATGALNMLGGAHKHPPKLLNAYRDIARIPAWLDGIDWVRQWSASHDIWGAGLPLACTPSTPAAWRDALFGWLNAQVDPETGFWRTGVKARSRLEYLGGAFHIWPVYAAAGRPLPHPKRVINSVLKLQRPDGSFDGGFGYGTMDGVWVLAYLTERHEHRRGDVVAALKRNLRGLMRLYSEARGRFFTDAHRTESRIASLAILQGALPKLLRSSRPWRNPWHRRELFVIRVEEAED
jgi:hypothetical protein